MIAWQHPDMTISAGTSWLTCRDRESGDILLRLRSGQLLLMTRAIELINAKRRRGDAECEADADDYSFHFRFNSGGLLMFGTDGRRSERRVDPGAIQDLQDWLKKAPSGELFFCDGALHIGRLTEQAQVMFPLPVLREIVRYLDRALPLTRPAGCVHWFSHEGKSLKIATTAISYGYEAELYHGGELIAETCVTAASLGQLLLELIAELQRINSTKE